MKRTSFTTKLFLRILTVCVLASTSLWAKENEFRARRSNENRHRVGLPTWTLCNINRVLASYDAEGFQEHSDPPLGGPGLVFPRGTVSAIFTAGLMWGGEVHDGRSPIVRVNGTTYNTGMTRGAILGTRTGITEDPDAPDVRIWRIRKDYATADLRQDAAEINQVDITDVTEAMIAEVRSQYATDWIEWPAHKGAPFYDSDGDGMYTPEIVNGEPVLYPEADEPGLANADQVVWYVCNDIRGGSSPWASPPAGLEQQGTIWAYNSPGFLGDVLFKRFKMIYKGTAETPGTASITNMYLCHWSDPDLGNYSDDLAGCDTVLGLGYVYNGQPVDYNYSAYGLRPPAVGYDFLQGPIAHTGRQVDTAFVGLKRITGAVNIPMTSFLYFAAGGLYSDPPFSAAGALQWNCMFQGRPPTPQPPPCPDPPIDPFTNAPAVPFWLYAGSDGSSAPNIFSPNGWVDGMLEAPADRRIIQSSGPFTMALGDTQEIILGVIGGQGNSFLNCIPVMKATSRNVQTMYNSSFTIFPPPFSVRVGFLGGSTAILTVVGDGTLTNAVSMEVDVRRPDGSPVSSAPLYDDGTHGDETPGDEMFTNILAVGREVEPLYLDVTLLDNLGRSVEWARVVDGIATVGSVSIRSERLFSDNLNSDGEANPGENIRYGFTVEYSGIATLDNLAIAPTGESEGFVRIISSFADGQVDSMMYDPNLPQSYFSAEIPGTSQDTVYTIAILLTDSLLNRWDDTISFSIHPLPGPVQSANVSHPVGPATGDFEILVVDAAAVNDHLYVIEGVNEPDSPLGISLRDSTDGRIIFQEHPLPDEHGHNMPVTEGFKVMLGSIETVWGWKEWSIPQGEQRWTWNSANGLQLEGFNGAMGIGYEQWFSSSLTLPQRARDVLIVFAATDVAGELVDPNDTTASFAYRYLRNADQAPVQPEFAEHIIHPDTGYAYQDFHRKLPFAAYDVNSLPPRRLAVGFLENNVYCGLVDGKYWPPAGSGPCFTCVCNWLETGSREWFFIFDAEYVEIPDPMFAADIEDETLPIMWWGTPNRLAEGGFQFGDQFLISAGFPFTSQDRWTFNPTIVTSSGEWGGPSSYELWQNYPNPFNSSTTITYRVPKDSRVELTIYDILGREVRTLLSGVQRAGTYRVQWDSQNSHGHSVSSGVYFYRFRGGSYVETRKLVVLK